MAKLYRVIQIKNVSVSWENVHTNKAYLSTIKVRHICKSFTYKMAAKLNWHRYGTKLRHRHPVYTEHAVYGRMSAFQNLVSSVLDCKSLLPWITALPQSAGNESHTITVTEVYKSVDNFPRVVTKQISDRQGVQCAAQLTENRCCWVVYRYSRWECRKRTSCASWP